MRAAPKRGSAEKLRRECPARSRRPSAQDASAAPQVMLRSSQLGKYVYVVSADCAAENIVSRGPWAIDITGLVETDCDPTATCRRSARLADRAEASSGFRRDMKEPRLGHLCRSVCK